MTTEERSAVIEECQREYNSLRRVVRHLIDSYRTGQHWSVAMDVIELEIILAERALVTNEH